MSDVPEGPGWWQASDLRWYPPEAQPGVPAPPPQPGPAPYGAYGQPPGGPWPGYGQPYAPALPSVQNQAVASLVLGVLGFIPCCWLNIFSSIAGLAIGLLALNKINKGAASDDGKTLAIIGIVLSVLSLVATIAFIVLLSANGSWTTGVVSAGVPR